MSGKPERSFGLLLGSVLILVALSPLRDGQTIRYPVLVPAAFLLFIALLRPVWIAPLHRAWTALGDVLHRLTTPIVIAALFFFVVTPCALVFRLLRRDALRTRRDPAANSYWIVRQNQPGSMTDQF